MTSPGARPSRLHPSASRGRQGVGSSRGRFVKGSGRGIVILCEQAAYRHHRCFAVFLKGSSRGRFVVSSYYVSKRLTAIIGSSLFSVECRPQMGLFSSAISATLREPCSQNGQRLSRRGRRERRPCERGLAG